jgi:hypothetical protein
MKLPERIEFRLDAQTKRLLQELAQSRGQSLGETIRELLKKELGTLAQPVPDKQRAASALVGLKVKPLPKPETLEEEIGLALGKV